MARRPKPAYPPELTKPIPAPMLGLLASDDQWAEAANNIVAEKWRRMGLLFDAHGVPNGDWVALCFAMAESHVTGFHVAKARPGRKEKWTALVRAELVLAVEATGLNVSQATLKLAIETPWRQMVGARNGASRLADEYSRADPRMVNLLRHARQLPSLPDTN